MKKKILGIALAMTSLLASCGEKQIKVNPDKEKYVVGICQSVQHEALDAATKGFRDNLSKMLKDEGRSVEFLEQNASGDIPLCSSIVNSFVAQDVDLIMSNATPAVQAAFSATEIIPILGTSVTDYGAATNLEMKDGKSGTNISGTSDLAKISDQIDIMLSLLPDTVKKVGIIYCSSEANSVFQVNEAKKVLESKGKTVVAKSFSETTDLTAVCNSMLDVDAMFLPTDNVVASNASLIKANITDKGIPVFAGESGICKTCGFATLSIDYYRLGEITGEMAFNVLLGKEDIRNYAIQYDNAPVKMYNKEIAAQLGITIPNDFVELK